MRTNSKAPKKAQAPSRLVAALLLVVAFLFVGNPAQAQCAMCRAAIESEGNTATAEAVNDGIVYLMVIPYILVGGIGYAIYRMKRK